MLHDKNDNIINIQYTLEPPPVYLTRSDFSPRRSSIGRQLSGRRFARELRCDPVASSDFDATDHLRIYS